MQVNKTSNYSASQYSDKEQDTVGIDKDLITLFQALQGRIRFGSGTSGTSGENIGGTWIKFLTSNTSGNEVQVAHKLGTVPLGYLVVTQDKAGSVYAEPGGLGINTAWTSGTSYFKSNVTNANFLVFLLERGG